jgi:hypothetical protein
MEDPVVWPAVILPAAAVGLITAFWLRTRLPAALVVTVLAAVGAALGWGGMLLRTAPSRGEVVGAIVLLAVLVPAHVRVVLGRFGPSAAGEPPPAVTPEPRPDEGHSSAPSR